MLNINIEFWKHILIFCNGCTFAIGLSLIVIFYFFRNKGKNFFSEYYLGSYKFYIPFFLFFTVNYIMFYDGFFIMSDTISIILTALFDITLVAFFYYWLLFNQIDIFVKIKKITACLSIIYVLLWLFSYIMKKSDYDRIPLRVNIDILIDTVFCGFILVSLIYCIFVYVKERQYQENQLYFIISNIILAIYLIYMYVADLYLLLCQLYGDPKPAKSVYFFDPILPTCLVITLYTLKETYREVQQAEIAEYKKYDEQLQRTTEDSLQKVTKDYQLSPRETEILSEVSMGKSNQQIAEEMYISIYTVKRHVNNIFKKTNTKSRYELIALIGKGRESIDPF